MKLTFKPLFIVLFALLIPCGAWADVEIDGIYYNLITKTKQAEVTNGGSIRRYSGNIIIPSTTQYEGVTYSVTSIGKYAFQYCSSLESVSIPNSVTTIGYSAFNGCEGLTSITIPNSVTSIGNGAFSGCNSLESIVVSSGNPVYDSRNNCNAIIETATNTLVSGCKSTIIPNSVTSIGNNAFQGCSGLTSVTIPDGVTSIGDYAFSRCSGLTSVTIPDGVTSIGESAFEYCSSLTSIVIPSSVTSIGENAFKDCRDLSSVTANMANPFAFGTDAFDYIHYLCSLHVPSGKKDAYINMGWDTSVFRGGVYSFGDLNEPFTYTYKGKKLKYKVIDATNRYIQVIDCDVSGTGSVEMPSSITYFDKTFCVTSIGDNAFYGCSGLTSVTIPDGVTTIEYSVFYGCSGLTSVTIPNSVTSIGDFAFYGCSGLTSVTIPDGVTSIGNDAFYGCSGLTSITIPNSVTSIGRSVLPGGENLSSIIVEPGNQKYDSRNNCNAIIITENDSLIYGCKNTIIPNNVKSIGERAFSQIDSFSIVIPEGVTTIGTLAFDGCTNLSVDLPNSIVNMNGGSFSVFYRQKDNGSYYMTYCENMKVTFHCKEIKPWFQRTQIGEVILGNEVTQIDGYAFSNCDSLKIVKMSNSLTSIGPRAFGSCKSLTSIAIPSSVTDYYPAFNSCNNITSIVVESGNPKYDSRDNCNAIILTECDSLIEGCKTTVIPNSVKGIGPRAFSGKGASTLIIPSTMKNIGNYAFSGCEFKSIIIPNSITRIEEWAFSGSAIESIIIPNSVNWISYSVFRDCKQLASVQLPDSIKSIPAQTFFGCSSLTSIVIPEGVKSIGSHAFYQCSNLSSIVIPDNVDNIYQYAFSYCYNLMSIKLPKALSSIREGLFNGCYKLKSIEIPNSVTSIESSAFKDCLSLKSIVIPNGVSSIGKSAFSGCSGLTSIYSNITKVFDIDPSVFSVYDTAILYVPASSMSMYETKEGWKEFNNIRPISDYIALEVKDENGVDVTNQVSIVWYNDKKEQIGTGAFLGGVEKNASLYYSIVLGNELGKIYRELRMQSVVADKNTKTYQLERLEQARVYGKVIADGLPAAKANVKVRQWLNGKYENVENIKTDAQGAFSLQVYNDSTEIIISYDGFLDSHIQKALLGREADLGTIFMERVHGKVLIPDFAYQAAVREGTTPTIQYFYSDVQNISYVVNNETKQAQIYDFSIQQNGNIIIANGVESGDELTITAMSMNGKFANVSVITTFDESDTLHVALPLVELGGVYVEYESMADDKLLTLVYDESGQLASRATSSTSRVAFTGLEAGTYSVVTMGYDGTIGSVSELSGLAAVGLEEGVDYILTDVTIRNGILSTVVVENVPEWESAKFSYMAGNTSYLPNKSQMSYGSGFVTMAARVDFSERLKEDVSDVKLVVNIPEGCELIDNCVVIDNHLVPYTLNDNTLTIPIPKEVMDTRIRFCFKPNIYGTFSSTAYTAFDYHGEHTQPVGTAVFEVTGAEIHVPTETNETNILIRGIALPKAEIDVYDNDYLIGSTQALGDGKWRLDCELFKPYNLSVHNIYAKITAMNGLTAMTEYQECFYERKEEFEVKAKSVTMSFYNGWLRKNIDVVFDFETGTTSSKSYSFYTATDVTFVADLTNNDTTHVNGVTFYVHTNGKEIRKLKGFFDEKLGRWVAVDNFDSWNLPVNLSLKIEESNYNKEPVGDRVYIDDGITSVEDAFKEWQADVAETDSLLSIEMIPSENEEIYQELERLWATPNFDKAKEQELLDKLYSNLPELGEDNMSDEEFEQLKSNIDETKKEFEEWLRYQQTEGKDSLLMALMMDKDILSSDKMLDLPFSYTISGDGNTYSYHIDSLSSINEDELLAEGYVVKNMTDGSKIYILTSESEMIYIDAKTNIKYSFVYSNVSQPRRGPIEDYEENETADFRKRLADILSHIDNLLDPHLEWTETANRVSSVISQICDLYEQSLGHYIDRLLDNFERNLGIERLNGEITNTEAKLNAYKSRIFQKPVSTQSKDFKDMIDIQNELKTLRSRRDNLVQVRQECQRRLNMIPRGLTNVKLAQSVRALGRLASGLGVFFNLYDLYGALYDYRANINSWIVLRNALLRHECYQIAPEKVEPIMQGIQDDFPRMMHIHHGIINGRAAVVSSDAVALGNLFTFRNPGVEIGCSLFSIFIGLATDYFQIRDIDHGTIESMKSRHWMAISKLSCKKKKETEPDTDPKPNEPNLNDDDWDKILHPAFYDITPIHDPSGYVYEAVPSNRMEGVTASIYYDKNAPQLWDAADFSQVNPIVTDEMGLYAWDVPQGMWQVRFEKDGYETQQTEWLPVPPPQLEINIPMQQAIAPMVTKARGAESGIWLTFSKYMKPETLTKNGRVSATCNGKNVKGEVEMLDLEEDPYNKQEYASKVKFVPDVAFNTTDEVIITVKKEVESYASMPMEADFVQRVTIEPEIKDIVCDSIIVIDYQNEKTVEIAVTPASATKGKTLHVESTSPIIVSVDRSEVTLNDEGKAYLTISGNLPGGAALLLSLPEAELTADPQVQVVMHENVVRKPKASKRTGSIVEEGFLLTLTSATPGAIIYYTTDGSCPCDVQTRQRYDGPIVIDKDMTINAIAVREGMDDSEVATFTYKVGDPSDINIAEIGQVSIEYDNGAFVITGAEGGICDVYDLSGQLMTSKRQLGSQERIVFHKKGMFVVNVETVYGVTYAKKMVVR